jgi:hypothetical protein
VFENGGPHGLRAANQLFYFTLGLSRVLSEANAESFELFESQEALGGVIHLIKYLLTPSLIFFSTHGWVNGWHLELHTS